MNLKYTKIFSLALILCLFFPKKATTVTISSDTTWTSALFSTNGLDTNHSIDSGATLTLNITDDRTYTAVISGAGNLTKSGSGTLTFEDEQNTITGTLTVADGILSIDSSSGFSTDDVKITAGATLQLDDKNFNKSSREIQLRGHGDGDIGALYASSGGSDNTVTNTSKIRLMQNSSIGAASGVVLKLTDNEDAVIVQQSGETNTLRIRGAGVVEVLKDIDLDGGKIIIDSGSTLRIGHADAILDDGELVVNGTLDVNENDTIDEVTGSGTVDIESGNVLSVNGNDKTSDIKISGAGNFRKISSDNLTLSGSSHDFTGNLQIFQGDIDITGSLHSGAVIEFRDNYGESKSITFDAADHTIGGVTDENTNVDSQTVTFATGGDYDLTLNVASGLTLDTYATFNGNSGTGQLKKSGTGKQIIQGAISGFGTSGTPGVVVQAGTLELTSTSNTFDGDILISGGTLEIGSNSGASGTGDFQMTGGQISSDSTTARDYSSKTIDLSGTVELGDATNTGALTFGATSISSATTLTVSSALNVGAVTGNNSFTKTGSGTMTVDSIAGSGGTTISGGTLVALSTGSSPNIHGTFTRTGTTTINNGGTLTIRGTMLGAAVPGDPTWNSSIVINSGGQLRTYFDGSSGSSILMSAANTITGTGEIYFEEVSTVYYRNNSDQTLSVDVTADSGFTQGGLELLGTGTVTYDGTVTAIIRVRNGTLKPGSNFDATGGTISISPNNNTIGNTNPVFDIDGETVTVETINIEAQSGTGQPSIIDSNSTPGSLSFTTLTDEAADDTTSKTIISAILSGTGTIKPRGSSTYSTSITSASTGFTGGFSFDKANSNLEITGTGSVGSEIIDMYASGLDSILTIDAGALAHSSPIIKIGPGDTLNVKGDEAFTLVNFIQIPGTEDATITLDNNVTIDVNIPSSYTESVHTGGDAFTANNPFNQVSLTGGANSRVKLVGSGTIEFHHFSDQSGSGGPGYSGDIEVAGATLTFGDSNEIHDSSDVIVSSGTLNFAARSDTFNSLTISGGTTTGTSTGTITVTNAMTVSGGTVSGKTFSAGSYALSGGTVSAVLAGSGNVTVSGDTTLNATNTFTGTVTVNSGATLRSDNNSGLGATSSGTTVASGGSLHLYSASGTKSYGEDITISGSGVSSSGAIQATGSNTITGDITLAANSTLVSNASATFTVGSAGSIDGSSGDYDLTLAGAGDFSFAGDINLGDGNLTISSTGTTTITGALTVGSYSVSSAATISNHITTSGAQSYLAGSSIGGTDNQAVTLTASSVTFGTSVAAIGDDIDLTITGNMTTTGEFESNASATFGLLSVSGTSAIGANITTNSTQTYTGATTVSANNTFTTTNSNLIFGNTLDSASSTARNLTASVGTGVVQFSGEVGGTQALGAISITGGLDLDANITSASSLSVSSTSNLGANVTTSGTQTYTGTATLSSDSTLTGSTVNFGGQIIGGSNALTITGNFDLDGAASGITNLSVSGTSNLGASVTTTGTQAYTGATTLSAATTLQGSTINLNAVTGGSNALTITGNLDLDGDIAGVTNLSVSGTTNIGGDVATINNQTYTGLTTVSASKTLSGAAITASVINLGSNDLGISNTTASSITGVVSGTGGSLTKLGSGALTLSNANTYTGDTTIDAGTLTVTGTLSDSTDVIVASGATYDVDENDTVKSVTGAGTTNVASSKTLILSSSDNGSSSTVFEGSGNLTKAGSGTLTLLGESTISGTVTVSGGILYAGNASSSSTTIIDNDVTINGGTLGGGGIISGTVTATSGTITPGNSIGTLNIGGDLNLTSNSTVTIEFNSTISDKIIVGGDINLAGTIVLQPADTTYTATTLTLIDGSGGSGSLSGTFATETGLTHSNLNGATASITYDTTNNKVLLNLTASTSGGGTVESTTSKSKLKSVGKIFDNATAGKLASLATYWTDSSNNVSVSKLDQELKESKGSVLALTNLQHLKTHNTFQKALSNVTSMGATSSIGNITRSSSNNLTLSDLQEANLFMDRSKWSQHYDYSDNSVLGFLKNNKNKTLLSGFTSEDKAAYIRTYGSRTKRKDIGAEYTGFDNDTFGILFGEQFIKGNNSFQGYSYGLSSSDTDYNNNFGESKSYSIHASIFEQIDNQDYNINYLAGTYLVKTNTERNVSVGGGLVDDVYGSEMFDLGINLTGQYTKKLQVNGWNLSPTISLQGSYEIKDDTKEKGGDLALTVKNDNIFTMRPELGMSLDKNISKLEEEKKMINFSIFASQEHYLDGTTASARYASDNTPFTLESPKDEESYVSVGLGYNFISADKSQTFSANTFYTKSTDNDLESNIFSLTYRKLFGNFGKNNIPPVIAKKPNDKKNNKTFSNTLDRLVFKKPDCKPGQIYKDFKCEPSEETLRLVAAKLYEIQKIEPTLGFIALKYYLEFVRFLPLITFILFIILVYESLRILVIKYYKKKY